MIAIAGHDDVPTIAVLLYVSISVVACSAPAQENWPRFRGADATGVVADDPRLPDTWDQEKNVRWRANIPGWSWGSPVVWGDRVFVSSVHSDVEYQEIREWPGIVPPPPDIIHHWMVYCLSLDTGELIWKREAHTGKPTTSRHWKNSYASETPTTDGHRLYVLFGDLAMYCYDFDGNLLWEHAIEPKKTEGNYGPAASPVVHDGQVIMVYDNEEESFIQALDGETGHTNWKTTRDEIASHSTPFVWGHSERTEIVTAGRTAHRSYSVNGESLWYFDGNGFGPIPSPFAADGLLYLTTGAGSGTRPTFAVAPGAKGDISLDVDETSNESIRWSLQWAAPYTVSPIVYRGFFYTLLGKIGIVTCHDAQTGKVVHGRKRIPQGGRFTASPWAYNGKVFFLSEDGTTYVMPVGPEFQIERRNPLDEISLSTPAISQGHLLIRTRSQIYCITNHQ